MHYINWHRGREQFKKTSTAGDLGGFVSHLGYLGEGNYTLLIF